MSGETDVIKNLRWLGKRPDNNTAVYVSKGNGGEYELESSFGCGGEPP